MHAQLAIPNEVHFELKLNLKTNNKKNLNTFIFGYFKIILPHQDKTSPFLRFCRVLIPHFFLGFFKGNNRV
jgi:hypothetical protein